MSRGGVTLEDQQRIIHALTVDWRRLPLLEARLQQALLPVMPAS